MGRIDFLERFKERANVLRHLFREDSLSWLDSVITGKTGGNGGSFTPESLYELLCYFSLLHTLNKRVQGLRLITPASSTGYRFPFAPANKDRFAFFRFEFFGRTFDLCLGTSLPDPESQNEPEETPDISLQRIDAPVSDRDVRIGKPVRIWDAKYHAQGRFAKADFQQLNTWCDILRLPIQPDDELTIDGLLSHCFKLSGVITNVEEVRFNARIAIEKRFRIVFQFQGDADVAVVRPKPKV